MSPLTFSLLSIAGGIGAATRFLIDGRLRETMHPEFEWATSIINLSGSFVLGLLTGLTDVELVSANVSVVIGTGFLGGYTTFSTASLETVTLLRAGRHGQALMSGVGMLVGCVALAAAGLWIGQQL